LIRQQPKQFQNNLFYLPLELQPRYFTRVTLTAQLAHNSIVQILIEKIENNRQQSEALGVYILNLSLLKK